MKKLLRFDKSLITPGVFAPNNVMIQSNVFLFQCLEATIKRCLEN